MDAEEAQHRRRAADFPHNPLPWFALGRFLVSKGRHAEAVEPLEQANRLQADFAAGLVSLGDAYSGCGRIEEARATLERAKEVALSQSHPSLAEEIDERLSDLG